MRQRTSSTARSVVMSFPAELLTEAGRRAWLARELAADSEPEGAGESEPVYEFDAEQIVARVQGRDGWLLESEAST